MMNDLERLRKLNDFLYLHTLEHHAVWDEKHTVEDYDRMKKEILSYMKLEELMENKINTHEDWIGNDCDVHHWIQLQSLIKESKK